MEKVTKRAKKRFYERIIGFSFLILLFFCLFMFCFILVNGRLQLFNIKYIEVNYQRRNLCKKY
jgi:hypothetical protein